MEVRDFTKKETEYKGHWIKSGGGGKNCPCLPCFDVHDCGYSSPYTKEWISIWDCATRYRNGCPDPLPRPTHIFKFTKRFDSRKPGDKFRCLRCRQVLEIGRGDFNWKVIPKIRKEVNYERRKITSRIN